MFQLWLQMCADMRHAALVQMYMPHVDSVSFLKWQYPAPAELQFAGVMC